MKYHGIQWDVMEDFYAYVIICHNVPWSSQMVNVNVG